MKACKFILAVFSLSMLMACNREGCTDQAATNYDPKADNDDGSCNYAPGGGTTGPGGQTLPINLTGTESVNRVIKDLSTDPNVVEYYVDGSWKIGAAIVVEPGVRIEMRSGAIISVKSSGSLDATGTPGNKIQILGAQDVKGYWSYISYESNNLNNKLIHCNISNGSGAWNYPGMVNLGGNAQVIVQNSSLTKGNEFGLYLNAVDGRLPDFKSNFFNEFDKNPLVLRTFQQSGTIDNSTSFGNNNLVNKIMIYGSNNYSSSVSVPKMSIPYYLLNDFKILGGHTSFQSGVNLNMGANAIITVESGGSLSFDGTASNRNVVSGDQPTKGFWKSIFVKSNNPNNKFSYTDFTDGSGHWNHPASIFLHGRLEMDNCTVSNGLMTAVDGDGNEVFINGGGNSWSNCDDGGGLLP